MHTGSSTACCTFLRNSCPLQSSLKGATLAQTPLALVLGYDRNLQIFLYCQTAFPKFHFCPVLLTSVVPWCFKYKHSSWYSAPPSVRIPTARLGARKWGTVREWGAEHRRGALGPGASWRGGLSPSAGGGIAVTRNRTVAEKSREIAQVTCQAPWQARVEGCAGHDQRVRQNKRISASKAVF